MGHRLEAIAPRGDGYTLSFIDPNGTSVEKPADILVLTVPFTLLRNVDIRVPLPPHKKRAIDELGYGTNAKIFAGARSRVWRDQGHNGFVYTDLPMKLVWDHTQRQPGQGGGLTFYSGGAEGLAAGNGTPEDHIAAMMPDLDRVFPGVAGAYTGVAKRMHWPTYPHTRASYTCYRPGQWTTLAGAEFEPVGNMYFAGEHCSLEFQGFMNGAAETGRAAAKLITRKAGVPRNK
jgi:monoamine oxidase